MFIYLIESIASAKARTSRLKIKLANIFFFWSSYFSIIDDGIVDGKSAGGYLTCLYPCQREFA